MFALLSNEQYPKKVQRQANRSSFTLSNSDPAQTFAEKINTQIEKWINIKVIDKNWKLFIKPKDVKPSKMCEMKKTHKESKLARIIISCS